MFIKNLKWQWRYRLSVRTLGFHPGKRGSIPRSVSIVKYYKVSCRDAYTIRVKAAGDWSWNNCIGIEYV